MIVFFLCQLKDFLLPLPNRLLTFILNDGLLEHRVDLPTGVLGIEKPLESCSIGDDDICIDAIPLLGVCWNDEDWNGIDGGGIGLIKLLPLVVELWGLIKLVHEANLRFWRSLEGVEAILIAVVCIGEIIEETALFRRLLVGVLLKLKARFTCF